MLFEVLCSEPFPAKLFEVFSFLFVVALKLILCEHVVRDHVISHAYTVWKESRTEGTRQMQLQE